MLRALEARARAEMKSADPELRVFIRNGMMAGDARSCQMHETEGYRPIRFSWHMEIKLEAAPRAPVWPDGIELRPFVKDSTITRFQRTKKLLAIIGDTPRTFEYWQHHMSSRRIMIHLMVRCLDHRPRRSRLFSAVAWDMAGSARWESGVPGANADSAKRCSSTRLMSFTNAG
jgi:hypothetical protein